VGLVTQDVQLFHATVRENLTFFNGDLRDADILDAIARLGLQSWFDALPDGLDTPLKGSTGLSAGEAQILAMTRMFLKNPDLIVLDEASSRLDPATERLVERTMDRLLAGRTVIIVAHRLRTIHRADKVLILSDGEIVEFGHREELASNSGSRFAGLLRSGLEMETA
jgi:ABC-type multidrug transport system fused ATPase/permease subunit